MFHLDARTFTRKDYVARYVFPKDSGLFVFCICFFFIPGNHPLSSHVDASWINRARTSQIPITGHDLSQFQRMHKVISRFLHVRAEIFFSFEQTRISVSCCVLQIVPSTICICMIRSFDGFVLSFACNTVNVYYVSVWFTMIILLFLCVKFIICIASNFYDCQYFSI